MAKNLVLLVLTPIWSSVALQELGDWDGKKDYWALRRLWEGTQSEARGSKDLDASHVYMRLVGIRWISGL